MASEQLGTYGVFIGGESREGVDPFDVTNPATGESIARVHRAGDRELEAAIEAAEAGLAAWQDTPMAERQAILRDVGDAIEAEADRLTRIESLETGRPLSETEPQIHSAAGYYDYYAGVIDKIQGDTIPVPGERFDYTRREPLGVTAHIVPWNAAFILGTRSFAPALACGNAVVAKPATPAPLSVLELARIASEAGLPDGLFNVVPGRGSEVGSKLVRHPTVRGVDFTGSRGGGQAVMRDAAENLVFAGLELGGKSPSLVFPDATLDRAVEDTLKVYRNAGQICFATTRVFVHEAVYDEFVEDLVARVEAMELGPPTADPDMGPVIDADALADVDRHVREAEADGATVLTGGYAPEREGHFYAPTVIADAADDAPISCDEVFGPVINVYEFETEEEAVRRANDTDYGLYGLVWTNDLSRAHRVSEAIEAGTVQVNEYSVYYPQFPSGGYKESGVGRVRGLQAVDRYTQLKNVTMTLTDEP